MHPESHPFFLSSSFLQHAIVYQVETTSVHCSVSLLSVAASATSAVVAGLASRRVIAEINVDLARIPQSGPLTMGGMWMQFSLVCLQVQVRIKDDNLFLQALGVHTSVVLRMQVAFLRAIRNRQN